MPILIIHQIDKKNTSRKKNNRKEGNKMAVRKMNAVAKLIEGKIPEAYQLTLDELSELHEMTVRGCSFEAYSMAFHYGFALALRMVKRDAKKKAKAAKT